VVVLTEWRPSPLWIESGPDWTGLGHRSTHFRQAHPARTAVTEAGIMFLPKRGAGDPDSEIPIAVMSVGRC
jgi:hypothetical protein